VKPLEVSERLRANYADTYAAGPNEWRRRGAVGKADNVVALCRDLSCGKVLEIGAGEGSVLRRLSELGFGGALYALEISRSAVAAIEQQRIPRLVDCLLYDGYHVPYGDAHFDVAILSHVLEHVEHPRQLLYEASRVARFVFVEVPLEDTRRLPYDHVPDAVGHINAYSPKTIRHLAQTCGLRVLRQITTTPSKGTYTLRSSRAGWLRYQLKQWLLAVAPALATRLFTYHAALLCETPRDAA
jgi:SAM-dependent methyltransferase